MLTQLQKQNVRLKLITLLLFNLFIFNLLGQGSVGIGTKEPNPHAVLDLVSPGNNQGFLAPRLTTSQRMSPGFISILSSADNGLLIFDVTLNKFFYWKNTQWEELAEPASTTTSTGPKGDKGDKGDTGVQGPKGDKGDTGAKGDKGDKGDLGLKGDKGDIGDKGIKGDKGDAGIKGDKGDKGDQGIPGMGIAQNLSSSKTNNLVTIDISGGTSTVINVDDSDSDPTNEIQDLNLSGNSLKVTKNTGATIIDLSPYIDNTDNQSISFNASNGQLTITNQASPVQLSTNGDVSGSLNNTTVTKIQNRSISATAPKFGEILRWNGSQWIPDKETESVTPTNNGAHLNGGINTGSAPPVSARENGMLWLESGLGGNGRDGILWIWVAGTSSWQKVMGIKGD